MLYKIKVYAGGAGVNSLSGVFFDISESIQQLWF